MALKETEVHLDPSLYSVESGKSEHQDWMGAGEKAFVCGRASYCAALAALKLGRIWSAGIKGQADWKVGVNRPHSLEAMNLRIPPLTQDG